MDVKKLKVGMEVKNYKELCELVGVKVRNGSNSKKKQFEEFKRYFEWEKIRYSFKITKIYSKPRAFTEQEMIELLLLHLLATNDNDDKYSIVTTRKSLYEKLQMVNSNYKYFGNHAKEVANYKRIPELVVLDTKTSINGTLKNKLANTLKNLSERKILFYSDVYIISYNQRAKVSPNFENSACRRVATKEESRLCVGIEGDVLKELKCDTYNDIIIQRKEKIYNNRIKEELSKHNINSFYRAIEIVFIERRVPDLVNKFIHKFKLSDKNYAKYTEKVNEGMQLQTRNNANSRFESAKVEIDEAKKKIEMLNRNIENSNHKHKGFKKLNEEEKRLKDKMIEEREVYEQELRKCEYRLEILEMRSDEKYPSYVEELIELVLNINTDECTKEIQSFLNSLK